MKGRVLPELNDLSAKGGQDMLVGNKGKQAIQKVSISHSNHKSSLSSLTCACRSQAVYDELVGLVDPGAGSKEPFAVSSQAIASKGCFHRSKLRLTWPLCDAQPKKGTTAVIMMVGLQGAGKTTTCTKVRLRLSAPTSFCFRRRASSY